MPGSDVERAVGQFRRALLQKERAAASEMVRVYGEAWQRVQVELVHLDEAYAALRQAQGAGWRPDQAWIYQQGRMLAMRSQIESELQRYTEYAYETVRREQAAAIASAEEHAEALVRRALGRAPVGISVQWNRIPTGAVERMIGMGQADSPLRLLLAEIVPRGAQAAMDVLIQGVLLGKNPRAMAPQLRAVLGGELWRSLRIARTETLRAYREATRASYQANNDVVEGWIWHSAADKRTCGACWAMHGSVHKLDEKLNDHPNGRCSMIPQTKTWAEIGRAYGVDFSGVPETRAPTPSPSLPSTGYRSGKGGESVGTGASLFGKLSREEQIGVLGPAKWAAWRDGRITLDGNPVSGIVGVRKNTVWGSMRYERSLRGILGEDEAKKYTRLALMGVAQRSGDYTADDLIRIAGIGLRDLTPEELQSVVAHVASAGFDQVPTNKLLRSMQGLSWQGKVLQSDDLLPNGDWHYLKHVILQREWPDGTTYNQYITSLKDVILDPNSGIMISRREGRFWDVTIVRGSEVLHGPNGSSHVLIEYRAGYQYWVTAYQPKEVENIARNRTDVKWIRLLK